MVERTTSVVGAIGELIVSADLLRRGFDVYRSVSPTAPCDLVAMRGDVAIRVEVRSGHYGAEGNLQFARKEVDAGRSDVTAIICHREDEIIYRPSLEEVLASAA